MRHHGLWLFLKVIGRKHMIFRGDKGLEEAPGAAGTQAQRLRVSGGDRIEPLRGGRQQSQIELRSEWS